MRKACRAGGRVGSPPPCLPASLCCPHRVGKQQHTKPTRAAPQLTAISRAVRAASAALRPRSRSAARTASICGREGRGGPCTCVRSMLGKGRPVRRHTRSLPSATFQAAPTCTPPSASNCSSRRSINSSTAARLSADTCAEGRGWRNRGGMKAGRQAAGRSCKLQAPAPRHCLKAGRQARGSVPL